MAADLTVDSLCGALRHFLKEVADGTRPVHADTALVLHGVPGDETMKAVLEQLNGTLKITVHELPAVLNGDLGLAGRELAGTPAANVWRPSQEGAEHGRCTPHPAGPSAPARVQDHGHRSDPFSGRGPEQVDGQDDYRDSA